MSVSAYLAVAGAFASGLSLATGRMSALSTFESVRSRARGQYIWAAINGVLVVANVISAATQ